MPPQGRGNMNKQKYSGDPVALDGLDRRRPTANLRERLVAGGSLKCRYCLK